MSQETSGGGGGDGGGLEAGALPDRGSDGKEATAGAQDSSRSILPTSMNDGTVASVGEKWVRDHDSGGTRKGKRPASSYATAITVGDSDHEIHNWSERKRRKKMRDMFSSLHALLPQLPPKADKSRIVDEAIQEIKSLQQKLQQLQKQKLERLRGAAPPEEHSNSATSQCQGPQRAGLEQPSMGTREATLADHAMGWPTAVRSPTRVSISRFPQGFKTWSSPNVVLSVSGEDAQISICATKKPGLFSTLLCVMKKHNLEVVSATISSDFFRIMLMIHARANGVSDQFPEILKVEEIYKMAIGEMILWLSSP